MNAQKKHQANNQKILLSILAWVRESVVLAHTYDKAPTLGTLE